jgi:hypothetical protein
MKLSSGYNFHVKIKKLYEQFDVFNSDRYNHWDKDIRKNITDTILAFPSGLHYFCKLNRKRQAQGLPIVTYQYSQRHARFDRIANSDIQSKLQELSRKNRERNDDFESNPDWDFRVVKKAFSVDDWDSKMSTLARGK